MLITIDVLFLKISLFTFEDISSQSETRFNCHSPKSSLLQISTELISGWVLLALLILLFAEVKTFIFN